MTISIFITLVLMAGLVLACGFFLVRGLGLGVRHSGLVVIPLMLAVVVYGVIGSPHIADAPFARRGEAVKTQHVQTIARQQQAEARFTTIKALLADNPDDPNVLLLLAEAAAAVGDFDTERAALEKRLGLTDDNHALLAEAMTRQAGGIVTDEALALLTEAITRDANDWRAAYLLGLHAEQNGRLSEAVALWQDLGRRVAVSADGEALLQLVNQRLTEAAERLNQPPSTLIISPPKN